MAAGDKTTGPGNFLAFKTAAVTGETQDKVQAVSLVGSTGTALTSLSVSSTGPTTGTQSSVANAVTTTSLLASNANRKGATIYNDDAGASLYVKLGATASTTSFSIKLAPGGYYEVPFGYTGAIDGIASVASGSARITELT